MSKQSSAGRWLAIVGWVLLIAAFVDLYALKTGHMGHSPSLLAVLFGGALLVFTTRMLQLSAHLYSRPRQPLRAVAELVLVAGVLVSLSGGMVNWLYGLQGAVILSEGDSVSLHGGTSLQAFQAGPLSRLEEMGVFVTLTQIKLLEGPGFGGIVPSSQLLIWRESDDPVELTVTTQEWAQFGSLRLHQGTYGFAPRIIIQKQDETILDEVVPFRTRRSGLEGIRFSERFSVERENLMVNGQIDLTTLDEGLRGHATLQLTIRRDSVVLGEGSLRPGHFAEIEEGIRVGFAGLEKWSEIDVSRHNYSQAVQLGAILALMGAIGWLLARWRSW